MVLNRNHWKFAVKFYLKLLLAVTIVISMGAANAESTQVGFSLDSKESSLQLAWVTFLRSESESQGAAAGLEIKWDIKFANADSENQQANIEDLIAGGSDLILARAYDSGAIGTSIGIAKDLGIPFVTFDRGSSGVQPTAHVGGDSYDQALVTGVAFSEILAEAGVKGQCIELQGMLTDINAVNRSKGWADGAKSGQYEVLVQVPTEWNPRLFFSGLTNALKAHPEANCVFAASDFAFPSIQAALVKAGRWAPTGDAKHIWLATNDLLPVAVRAMEESYIDVSTTWDAFLQAKEAVRVIIALLKGESPNCGENGCLAKGRVVTPATIGTMENIWSRDY